MSPDKGIEHAIAVARLAGVPLKMAARIEDEGYFAQVIAPQLQDPLVEYLGIVNEQEKRALLCGALALLLPINWPEPFGMVFIEAMACGAPVLTCPHGAAPEIVVDGKTGFLRATVEELAAAVEDVRNLSRTACREHVRNHFHGHRMATEYVELFEDVQALSH
jgi:glycosyltransferase involved in cell wall biosynthesis